MAIKKNIFRYTTDKSSKRVVFEAIGTRQFYVGEDMSEEYAIQHFVTHAGRFIIKNGRGTVLARVEAYNK